MFNSKATLSTSESQIFTLTNPTLACDKLHTIFVTQLSPSLGTYGYRYPTVSVETGLSDSACLHSHTGGHSGHLAASESLAALAEEGTPSDHLQQMPKALHWLSGFARPTLNQSMTSDQPPIPRYTSQATRGSRG